MTRGYVSADAVAATYAAVGDSARAIDMLERALNEHTFTLVFLPHYPMFDAFHNNPRYRKIVERIGVIAPKR
jgi:hypothetical protein